MEDESPYKKKIFTAHQAKLKAESFCAYQERAQQEVRDKLYLWGLHAEDVENIISDLIGDNYLNEERFALAYSLGKFRIKKWGKIKISQHLKAKRVSKPLIKLALNAIDLDDYEKTLDETILAKIKTPISKITLAEKAKLVRFLQSKGFESELIFQKIADFKD